MTHRDEGSKDHHISSLSCKPILSLRLTSSSRLREWLVIFEAAKSTLLAVQGDKKLPSLKSLQAEQQRLLEDQQRLYDERAKLKKEARVIGTMKANVDDFLSPTAAQNRDKKQSSELE